MATDAISIASMLVAAGHSVDVGIMQVNSGNFARLGLTVDAAFNVCRSIAAGATILSGDYAGGADHAQQQSALRIAIARYNTGDAQRGFANGYVGRVEAAARHIIPALDVGVVLPPSGLGPHPTASVVASPTPGWDVFPSDEESASDGGKPQSSRAEKGAVIMADAGEGASAPVVNYPAPLER